MGFLVGKDCNLGLGRGRGGDDVQDTRHTLQGFKFRATTTVVALSASAGGGIGSGTGRGRGTGGGTGSARGSGSASFSKRPVCPEAFSAVLASGQS